MAMMRGVACLFRLCGFDLNIFWRFIPVCDVKENRQWRSVGPDERLHVYFYDNFEAAVFLPLFQNAFFASVHMEVRAMVQLSD